MKTSNTRNVTGLYLASGKNDPLHIGGIVGGKAMRICSLPAHLNNRTTPNARELRGIIEGRSIVAAAPWTAVDGTAFDAIGFAITSAETALDTANEFDSLIAAVAAHRENVADTLRDNDRMMYYVQAINAFDTRMAELSPLYASSGITTRRDSTAGDNGTLVDVDEVLDGGAVVGHVFAAVNPARGQVQFKAQANGGKLIAWDRDFMGAVRSLVAASRQDSAVTASIMEISGANLFSDEPQTADEATVAQCVAWQSKPVSPGDAVAMAAAVMAGLYEAHGIGDDCGAVDYVIKMSPEVESPEYLYSMIASWCELLAELRAIDIDVPALKVTFASAVALEFGGWLYHAMTISGVVPTSDECEAKIAQLAAAHMCRAGGDLPLALDMVDSVVHPRS